MAGWAFTFQPINDMGKNAQGISHQLFYLKDGKQESVECINMRIERCKGYTVAYSYKTPIAVYPDEGGYVLIDSGHHSATTDRHQGYLRLAVAADVELISFDWRGCNDTCWLYCYWHSYKVLLRKFLTAMEKHVKEIGKWNPNAYLYAKDRKRILDDLQALHRFFSKFDRKRAVQAVEGKVAYINDPVRIKAGQKRCAAERAKARETRKLEARERGIADEVRAFLKRSGDMRERIKLRVGLLLERYPLCCLKLFSSAAKEVKVNGACEQMVAVVGKALDTTLRAMWNESHPPTGMDNACDLCFSSITNTFLTSKSVSIGYDELQRCLKLWKRGRIVGTMVDGTYRVIGSNSEALTIGCHTFPREVVERIYARYAGKAMEEIRKEEESLVICYRADVASAIQIVTEEIARAMVKDPEAAAALRKLGVLQLEAA